MKNSNYNRLSPLKLKNGTNLSNRIVIPAMASETSTSSGEVTDQTIAHYSRLSEAQAGLIFVEYTFVHPSGRSEANQLGIDRDQGINGLKKIADVIRKSGAIAGIQLTHSGGKSETQYTGGILQSPSGVIVPVKDKELEKPSAMNSEDIESWKVWFLEAAHRAVKAGFNLIELHAAHGYGLNQWLSPITNKRTDGYGGSVANNSRLLIEIIESIRFHHPDILLSVRMPGQDFLESGLTIDDSICIAQKLQDAGVDIINISSGIGGWRRPRTRTGEGYLVEEASIIQGHTSLPVIGVGGIETGAYIDELIMNKKISLAAVGRAILKDPAQWKQNQIGSVHYA